MSQNGKGSARRGGLKESKAFEEGWERIFGRKEKKSFTKKRRR